MLRVQYKSAAPCCHCGAEGTVLVRGEDAHKQPFMGAVCWEHLRALTPEKPLKQAATRTTERAGLRSSGAL